MRVGAEWVVWGLHLDPVWASPCPETCWSRSLCVVCASPRGVMPSRGSAVPPELPCLALPASLGGAPRPVAVPGIRRARCDGTDPFLQGSRRRPV